MYYIYIYIHIHIWVILGSDYLWELSKWNCFSLHSHIATGIMLSVLRVLIHNCHWDMENPAFITHRIAQGKLIYIYNIYIDVKNPAFVDHVPWVSPWLFMGLP